MSKKSPSQLSLNEARTEVKTARRLIREFERNQTALAELCGLQVEKIHKLEATVKAGKLYIERLKSRLNMAKG